MIQTCNQEQESWSSHGVIEKGNNWGSGERAEGIANLFWAVRERFTEHLVFEQSYGKQEAIRHSMQTGSAKCLE